MSRILLRGGVAATLLILLWSTPAWAHEQRQVGAYQLTVGWQHEPAYTDTLNAAQLLIHDAKGAPVDDLGNPPTLHVTVTTNGQTSPPLDLRASFDSDTGLGTHGEFDASVIPTRAGDYTFHFTGTIAGQAIDQSFTSSDKTFDSVVAPAGVQFPDKLPAASDITTSISKLGPRIDAATVAAKSDKDKASTATTLAVIALAVGAVLGGGGILIGLSARRSTA